MELTGAHGFLKFLPIQLDVVDLEDILEELYFLSVPDANRQTKGQRSKDEQAHRFPWRESGEIEEDDVCVLSLDSTNKAYQLINIGSPLHHLVDIVDYLAGTRLV